MTTPTKGFAVYDEATGLIEIRTVAPTLRAAKVNALWVAGVQVTNDWSEQLIGEAFEQVCKTSVAVPIEIIREVRS